MSQDRFRKIALSLSEVVEGAHHGTADFRVGTRIFATLGYPDKDWGVVKLTPEQQAVVVEAEPEIFRPVPGGWGKGGSTNVRLAKADATTLRSALTMARDNIAAKPAKKATREDAVLSAMIPHCIKQDHTASLIL
ncbi:MmcQ/YjbR family DNA-binding protein [Bradyrhizobium sp. USDA 3364]